MGILMSITWLSDKLQEAIELVLSAPWVIAVENTKQCKLVPMKNRLKVACEV